jgi:hypothetical protein
MYFLYIKISTNAWDMKICCVERRKMAISFLKLSETIFRYKTQHHKIHFNKFLFISIYKRHFQLLLKTSLIQSNTAVSLLLEILSLVNVKNLKQPIRLGYSFKNIPTGCQEHVLNWF